ncbi:ABC transporter substrate-binding protein [Xanthobacter versatilis]|uniref:ABC transporter substrate-binding protein n=1 Tax=Xanthobacter autotrophicus (strain ATCC BAA-1158 / Py2) TaxID=78245 RepID=UPI0037293077
MTDALFSRRALMAGAAALLAGRAMAAPGPRVVAFDWGIVETLLGLGVVPAGGAEGDGYAEWVREPALPPGIPDLGLRVEPNMEAVARLRPDLIVITPQLASFEPMLARIAPTLSLAIFDEDGDVWTRARQVALALAAATGRKDAGARLLAQADAALEAARPKVAPLTARPLYLASFVDARHVRVYGRGSLFDAVLTRLGIANAFTGPTSFWGFATFGLEHLAAAQDAALLVFEPVPPEARATLAHGPLWQRLPMVEAGRIGLLPTVWSFGGLVSAMRFARVLADHAAASAVSGAGKGDARG